YLVSIPSPLSSFFSFTPPAPTVLSTLSLHDALPDLVRGFIKQWRATDNGLETLAAAHCDTLLALDEIAQMVPEAAAASAPSGQLDRKSTRLNSSHSVTPYALFCVKKQIPHTLALSLA